jgi:hypothetical protein
MMTAGPDMMSRFSIFKKFKDRQWIRLSKISVKRAKKTSFPLSLLQNTLNQQGFLEKTVERG